MATGEGVDAAVLAEEAARDLSSPYVLRQALGSGAEHEGLGLGVGAERVELRADRTVAARSTRSVEVDLEADGSAVAASLVFRGCAGRRSGFHGRLSAWVGEVEPQHAQSK